MFLWAFCTRKWYILEMNPFRKMIRSRNRNIQCCVGHRIEAEWHIYSPLAPFRRQTIIWINDGLLLVWPLEQPSVKFWSKYNNFRGRKRVWRCRLQNGDHLVPASVYWSMMCIDGQVTEILRIPYTWRCGNPHLRGSFHTFSKKNSTELQKAIN